MPEEFTRTGVNRNDIMRSIWTLRHLPIWRQEIKQCMFDPKFEDAGRIAGWLRYPLLRQESFKLMKKLDRELRKGPESWANQQEIFWTQWSVETRDALCRAILHVATNGEIPVDKPSLILKPGDRGWLSTGKPPGIAPPPTTKP